MLMEFFIKLKVLFIVDRHYTGQHSVQDVIIVTVTVCQVAAKQQVRTCAGDS